MFWPQSTFFNSTLIFFLSSIACIFPFPPTVRILQFLAIHMAMWMKDHIHQLHLHLSVLNQKDSSKWCVSYFFEVPPIFFRPNRLQMFQPEVNQLQGIAWWSHTEDNGILRRKECEPLRTVQRTAYLWMCFTWERCKFLYDFSRTWIFSMTQHKCTS